MKMPALTVVPELDLCLIRGMLRDWLRPGCETGCEAGFGRAVRMARVYGFCGRVLRAYKRKALDSSARIAY